MRTKTSNTPKPEFDINSKRFLDFVKSMNKQMTEDVDSVGRREFDTFIRKDSGGENYGTAEITKYLKYMNVSSPARKFLLIGIVYGIGQRFCINKRAMSE